MDNSTILITLHGHNMFDVSSMVQKSIRRGKITDALYAAHEMMYRYRSYLWKRLLTVSAEDCNGLMTGKIAQLKEKDCISNKDEFVSSAVNLLVNASKNRDADYFVCNLFNNKNRLSIEDIYPSIISAKSGLLTHNWHAVLLCKKILQLAIRRLDTTTAGYCGFELYLFHRPYFWKCINEVAAETEENRLKSEILALTEVDTNQGNTTNLNQLFASKAIVLLMKYFSGDTTPLTENVYTPKGFEVLPNGILTLPDYVYDCHTIKGRLNGKTTETFIYEEQKCLYPKVKGMFDKCEWKRFLEMKDSGFENTMSPPPMAKKNEIALLMNGIIQQELF